MYQTTPYTSIADLTFPRRMRQPGDYARLHDHDMARKPLKVQYKMYAANGIRMCL